MNVQPKVPATPTPPKTEITQSTSPYANQKAKDARARAIAILENKQAAPRQEALSEAPKEVAQEALAPTAQEEAAQQQVAAAQEPEQAQQEAAAQEAPKAEEAAAEELPSQYAQLAKKERALRAKVQAQEKALRERELALAAKEEEIKQKAAKYDADYIPKSRLSEETLAVLAEAGISYDQVTQQILQQPQIDAQTKAYLTRLENEIKTLKQSQEEAKKAAEASQTQQYQEAVKQLGREVKSLTASDPEKFEAIEKSGAHQDVVELIETVYKEEGFLMSVEEAAQLVEDELVEQYVKSASAIKKVNSKFKPVAPAQKPSEAIKAQSSEKQSQIKTLTNAVGSTRTLSARERAILAFKGENK